MWHSFSFHGSQLFLARWLIRQTFDVHTHDADSLHDNRGVAEYSATLKATARQSLATELPPLPFDTRDFSC